MLSVKPSQNLILDLHSSRYNEPLKPMIECLQFSLIAQALIMVDSIPLFHLSKAYSFATYLQPDGLITFKKPNTKDQKDNETSTSKYKEKLFNDEEEEEVLFEGEKLIGKKRDVELDNLLRVYKELEAKDADAEIVKITLAT
ncbi:unnamed protein product [Lactuca saligna]|uniref:Uncharacterized protein n=1 Tax=Lactuca saligna TaxID=75948 RepID=A0AA35V425_LACSI|nr:unnamed protein product [Lactuca saligna]